MEVYNDLKPHHLTIIHHSAKVHRCIKLSLHEPAGLWPVKETNEHKKRKKNVRSWAARVNCPRFSGVKQAVQTSTATSPTMKSPRGVPYIGRHQGPEKQVMEGERRADVWLKQRNQRERERGIGMFSCTFPRTGGLFPRNICNKPLQRTHTHTFEQLFLLGHCIGFQLLWTP